MELSLSQFSRKIGLLILRLVRLMKDKKPLHKNRKMTFFTVLRPTMPSLRSETIELCGGAAWWNKQADLRSQVIYPTRKEEINFESGTRLDKGAEGVTDIGRQILGVADN